VVAKSGNLIRESASARGILSAVGEQMLLFATMHGVDISRFLFRSHLPVVIVSNFKSQIVKPLE
jgi:hypothetical protein